MGSSQQRRNTNEKPKQKQQKSGKEKNEYARKAFLDLDDFKKKPSRKAGETSIPHRRKTLRKMNERAKEPKSDPPPQLSILKVSPSPSQGNSLMFQGMNLDSSVPNSINLSRDSVQPMAASNSKDKNSFPPPKTAPEPVRKSKERIGEIFSSKRTKKAKNQMDKGKTGAKSDETTQGTQEDTGSMKKMGMTAPQVNETIKRSKRGEIKIVENVKSPAKENKSKKSKSKSPILPVDKTPVSGTPVKQRSPRIKIMHDPKSTSNKSSTKRNESELKLLQPNIDEILRLGAMMERHGMSIEKKNAFEWIALNRGQVDKDKKNVYLMMSAQLNIAVGDLQVDRALVLSAIFELFSCNTIVNDEYYKISKLLSSLEEPLTIGHVAFLMRSGARFYSKSP